MGPPNRLGREGRVSDGGPSFALNDAKGPKVRTVKYKRRKGYHKTIGHRQKYTKVRVSAINV